MIFYSLDRNTRWNFTEAGHQERITQVAWSGEFHSIESFAFVGQSQRASRLFQGCCDKTLFSQRSNNILSGPNRLISHKITKLTKRRRIADTFRVKFNELESFELAWSQVLH